ncbi:GlxA family transcriptional regulator [Vibrio paucivorans]
MRKERQFTPSLRTHNRSFLPSQHSEVMPINAVFVLLENFSLVSFTSAADALVTANLVTTSPIYHVSTISIDDVSVTSDLGIKIEADRTLDDLSKSEHIDLLIVCGGYRSQLNERPNLSRKINQVIHRNGLIGGLWNGTIALAHAGAINNAQCSLHPDNHAYMKEHFPDSNVSDLAYRIDKQVCTSAGTSSSLEMMLELIKQQQGTEIEEAIRDILACDRANYSQEVTKLQDMVDPSTPDVVKNAIQLMISNTEDPLSIDELAFKLGTSRRRLERLFQASMQVSPSRYYLELRLTSARQLLLQSNVPIADIATASGFTNSNYFSRCFKEYFSVSPLALRHKHRR